MRTITKAQAANLILHSEGRIFSAEVAKRTTGEARTIVARLYSRSDERVEHDTSNIQVTVVDMNLSRAHGEKSFRTIALERVMRLAIDGRKFNVRP